MDYCDKPAEAAANPRAKQLMLEVANGNAAAFQWMWDLWCFEHLLDDLVDGDKTVTIAEAARALAQFVTALSVNPFYVQNVSALYPLIVSACARWVDGDALDKSDHEADRIRGEVVRCGDIDVFVHVALLVGGWDHMLAMSCRIRQYDRNERA